MGFLLWFVESESIVVEYEGRGSAPTNRRKAYLWMLIKLELSEAGIDRIGTSFFNSLGTRGGHSTTFLDAADSLDAAE